MLCSVQTRQLRSANLAVQQSLPSCYGDCDGNHNAVFSRNYKETCQDMSISPNSAVLRLASADPKAMCLLRLKALSFRNFLLGDRGIEALLEGLFPNLPHLELVNLAGTGLRNSSAARLLQVFSNTTEMPKLCALDFGDNPALTTQGIFEPLLRASERNPNFLDLGVRNTGIDRISEMVLHIQLVVNRQEKMLLDIDAQRSQMDGHSSPSARMQALYKAYPEAKIEGGLDEDFPDSDRWALAWMDDPSDMEPPNPRAAFAINRWHLEISRLRKIESEVGQREKEAKHRLNQFLHHRMGGLPGGRAADLNKQVADLKAAKKAAKKTAQVTEENAKTETISRGLKGRRYSMRSSSPDPRRKDDNTGAEDDDEGNSPEMSASLKAATLAPNVLSQKSIEGVSALQGMLAKAKHLLKESEANRQLLAQETAHHRIKRREAELSIVDLKEQLQRQEVENEHASVAAQDRHTFASAFWLSQLDLKDRVIGELMAEIDQLKGGGGQRGYPSQSSTATRGGGGGGGPSSQLRRTDLRSEKEVEELEEEDEEVEVGLASLESDGSAFGRVGGKVMTTGVGGGQVLVYQGSRDMAGAKSPMPPPGKAGAGAGAASSRKRRYQKQTY